MQVKDFIKTFGIEKLQGKEVEQNGETFKIFLSDDDLENHSLKHPDWNGSKERLDRFHTKGNYRFYAIDEDYMCVWVHPTTEIFLRPEGSPQLSFLNN